MRELALFAGAGGGILGGVLHGWRTVAAVEIEEYPRAVLLQRQADGILPRFPVWDDIRTFDGRPWRGKVDVITGGFPCQDISAAGRGEGITGSRSGLWSEMARVISEVRPLFCFVENSPLLVSRGLDVVLSDLAALGYDAEWGVIGDAETRGLTESQRFWLVAASNGKHGETWMGNFCDGKTKIFSREIKTSHERWVQAADRAARGVNRVAYYLERGRAIGNGQVPAVAALAWSILWERINGDK